MSNTPTATGFSTRTTTIAGDDIAELQLKYEYSTVFAGCNPFTPALDVKGLQSVEDIIAYQEELNNILRKCDLSEAGGNRIEALCNSLKSALNILGNKSSDDTEIIEIVRKTLFN